MREAEARAQAGQVINTPHVMCMLWQQLSQ